MRTLTGFAGTESRGRIAGAMLPWCLCAMLTPAAAEDAADEEAADRAVVLALKDRARARGERIDWAEFVPEAAPENFAAHAAVIAWGERHEATLGKLENENKALAELFAVPTRLPADFRARLAKAGDPMAAMAAEYAALDAVIAGPRATCPIRADLENMFDMDWSSLRYRRAMARAVRMRTLAMAVRDGGEAACAEWTRTLPLTTLYTHELSVIGWLTRVSARNVMLDHLNTIMLLDPPPPVTLRAMAERVRAMPAVEPLMREALTTERAAVERFYFMDPAMTQRNPLWPKRIWETVLEEKTQPLSDEQATALAALPCMRPFRNLRALWENYDLALTGQTVNANHGFPGQRQIKTVLDAFARGQPPPDVVADGLDAGRPAWVVEMAIPAFNRIWHMARRDDARRTALAHALTLLADRLEHDRPYALAGLPDIPLTGGPYATVVREGCLGLDVSEGKVTVWLPLYPGDDGYDPEAPWHFGHDPLIEEMSDPPRPPPAAPDIF